MSGVGPGYLYLTEKDLQALRFARLPRMLQRCGRASIPILRRLNGMAKPLWLWRLYRTAGDLADQGETLMWCARTGLPEEFSGLIIPHEFRPAFYRDPNWLPEAHCRTDELLGSVADDFADESRQNKVTFIGLHCRASEASMHWNHWWSRAHGLTVRFPYVDDDLIDYQLQLPRDSSDKEDIRRFAEQFMPRNMAYYPKTSQTVPITYWFRGALKDFLHDRLSPDRIEESGIFSTQVVQNAVRTHISGKNDHGWKLWAILSVITWQELANRRDLLARKLEVDRVQWIGPSVI
jgi:hypothetical protein